MNTERYRLLNHPRVEQGEYVLYRMQASPRTDLNLALAVAVGEANRRGLPLKVVFRLDAEFPEANYRHFFFLITRLKELEAEFDTLGIEFHIVSGDFESVFTPFLADAACVVTDKGYLRIQRFWSAELLRLTRCPFIEVEDNLVIPVESASTKREWAARTIRPRLLSKLNYFLQDGSETTPPLLHRTSVSAPLRERNDQVINRVLSQLRKRPYPPSVTLRGDYTTMSSLLDRFVTEKLSTYDSARNHPELAATSRLSAFLHFGMISPLEILKRVNGNPLADSFIEQLVVRRELAHNFIYYTPDYDSFHALPTWALQTLNRHAADPRPYLYSDDRLEAASTHDACWNAAMTEMIETGYMENTMRMYWGKKIIEWSESPEEAYHRMLTLNNRYFLDGRDANSFVGVGWCFGLHDRPWQDRPVFGTVRYMNEQGLRRKYDMEEYIRHFF
ncbi:MAG: deoxyribodipyrimidine photo-lyase [Bacteroidales bacterium]